METKFYFERKQKNGTESYKFVVKLKESGSKLEIQDCGKNRFIYPDSDTRSKSLAGNNWAIDRSSTSIGDLQSFPAGHTVIFI